jgi:hypothetical protein
LPVLLLHVLTLAALSFVPVLTRACLHRCLISLVLTSPLPPALIVPALGSVCFRLASYVHPCLPFIVLFAPTSESAGAEACKDSKLIERSEKHVVGQKNGLSHRT